MKSSIEFINALQFSRIETFSLFRQEIYQESIWTQLRDRESLQKKQEQLGSLTKEESARLEELMLLSYPSGVLRDEKGNFHPSSEKIAAFSAESPEVKHLIEILNTPIVEVPSWMCAPVYRDAIAFYNEANEIVATLNVCLSCEDMCTATSGIDADGETYRMIRAFFIEIGHPVRDDER